MPHVELNHEQLNQAYENRTAHLRCWCTVAVPIVGGQPASRSGVEAFVEHHLKIIDPEERKAAVDRILKEEVGEHDVDVPEGEIEEKEIYGINVVRRTSTGVYLGNWMLKAGIKQAASRLKLFTQKSGSKGDFSEGGRVRAIEISLRDKQHPEQVYIVDPQGKPVSTYFAEFMGSVTVKGGRKSIKHHSECIPSGSRFAFEYRFLPHWQLTTQDMIDIMGMWINVGVGSVRSLENGKCRVDRLVIDLPEKKEGKKDKKETKLKAKSAAA